MFRRRSRGVKSLEELSGQVAHHDWEHGKCWETIKVFSHRNYHLHEAVVMIGSILQDMAREGKLDSRRVEQIQKKLIEAMGRPV